MLLHKYFVAWLADWTGRMSGSASLALTFWATFFPPTANEARWLLLAAAVVSFILGSYHIWSKEHRALIDEQTYPKFQGKIEEDFIYIGATERRLAVTFIPVVVSLVNIRPAKASIERFELTIVVEGKEYKTRHVPTDYIKLERPTFDKYGLPVSTEGTKEEYRDLYKHRYEPCERGTISKGWLLFVLLETLIQPNTDCSLRLTVIDAFGRPHHLEETKRTRKQSGEIVTIREAAFGKQ